MIQDSSIKMTNYNILTHPLLLVLGLAVPHGQSLSFSTLRSAIHHLDDSPSLGLQSVQDLANVRIPRRDGGGDILAFQSSPSSSSSSNDNNNNNNFVVLIHEFFGLSESICTRAKALSEDLDCTVIAPDTFRGESSTFIPKCIWLALTTPQDRVNQDLEDVVEWIQQQQENNGKINDVPKKLAVMGFCYGGGKALRYTIQKRPDAATVVCYGSPVTDSVELSKLQAPVCGVFGEDDIQFPKPVLDKFETALQDAQVPHTLQVYPAVGHAFLSDMEQVRRGDQPQANAYRQVTSFLQNFFGD